MNKRNFQIFGPTKTTKRTLLIVIAIILFIAAWLWITNQSPTAALVKEPSNKVTGANIQQQSQEQQNQELQQQEQLQQETTQGVQDKKYYTYKEQCAFNIKQRQDDVDEITARMKEYQEELDKLTADYEKKKKELEDQYTVPSTNFKRDIEKVTRELQNAETRLSEVRSTCD